MASNQDVAVITGAGSGIGRTAAQALAEQGYRLVLSGRREHRLQETAATLVGESSNVLCVVCDVTREAEVNRLFDATVAAFGRVDLLFNNAGRGLAERELPEIDVAEWRDVLDVNLTGMFLCARAAYRVMKHQTPRGGRIINNGSISAERPRPGSAGYTSAKHGVSGLTKTIALDGRAHHIACGQIDIGNASTGLGERMSQGMTKADGSSRPEPTMDVTHVGQAIVFMGSLPLSANVQHMTLLATNMPFVGRG
ncbi:MAG: SDR family NAD(P)-dependent oxidoreductase [Salinisphaera sp.]|jgi:NADP-dependent 3-hydroxy acid dehydrogenase YdfG|nr:SDR family NAD(P)-dependent oxidoreductase [Salinisphaera sp.]